MGAEQSVVRGGSIGEVLPMSYGVLADPLPLVQARVRKDRALILTRSFVIRIFSKKTEVCRIASVPPPDASATAAAVTTLGGLVPISAMPVRRRTLGSVLP